MGDVVSLKDKAGMDGAGRALGDFLTFWLSGI